jgi:hypothetical protein
MNNDELKAYLLSFDGIDDGPVYLNRSNRRIEAGEFVYVENPGDPVLRMWPTLDNPRHNNHAEEAE